MSKTRKLTYVVEDRKYTSFEKAAAVAVDMALRTGEGITITEYNRTGKCSFTIRAMDERVEE
jgi:hypothetical protein